MFHDITVEICAGGIEDVITASRFPIDRIELNSALELGGLTPSLASLKQAKLACTVPVMCMVRPRPAGFVYTEHEVQLMKQDVRILLENGADGIVFGFLNPDHTVDRKRTEEFASLIHSHGKTAVFHRAFDLVNDPEASIQDLIHCGIDRLLTSGCAETAPLGADVLKSLQKRYGDQIEILPGCGIQAENVSGLLSVSGCRCFHMTAKSMRQDDGEYAAVDARNIQAVMDALGASIPKKPTLLTREDDELMKQEQYEKPFDQR